MKRLEIACSFFVLLLTLPGSVDAQENDLEVFLHPKKFYKKYFPDLRIKKPAVDSSYIKSYPNYLTTGIHLLSPTIDLEMESQSSRENASNATSDFKTNVGHILAFSVGYRFISAGFAMVVSSDRKDKEDYASTAFRTATIKYNNAAYYLQFKYMRTKGFTDVNEHNTLDPSQRYTKRGDLMVKEYQFEGMYNFSWKKYAYYAPIDYRQRQLKSRIGLLLKGGVYYNQLSADSTLLTVNQRPFFDEFGDIRTIRSTSFKVAPGVGANVVFFKRFYLSAALFTPYNLYMYTTLDKNDTRVRKGNSIALVLDGNVSLGYQSERLYAGIRYQGDNKSVNLNTVEMNTLFSYFGFDIGYRFNTPRMVKKVYEETMPPGM